MPRSSWTFGGVNGSVAGPFTYTPAAGTVLSAGNNQTLSVALHAHRHDRLHHGHRNGDDQRLAGDADDHLGQSREHRLRHGPERNAVGCHAHPGPSAASMGACRERSPTRRPRAPSSRRRQQPDAVGHLHAHRHDRLHDRHATATINVVQATPTITWANPADIVYGTAL